MYFISLSSNCRLFHNNQSVMDDQWDKFVVFSGNPTSRYSVYCIITGNYQIYLVWMWFWIPKIPSQIWISHNDTTRRWINISSISLKERSNSRPYEITTSCIPLGGKENLGNFFNLTAHHWLSRFEHGEQCSNQRCLAACYCGQAQRAVEPVGDSLSPVDIIGCYGNGSKG